MSKKLPKKTKTNFVGNYIITGAYNGDTSNAHYDKMVNSMKNYQLKTSLDVYTSLSIRLHRLNSNSCPRWGPQMVSRATRDHENKDEFSYVLWPTFNFFIIFFQL